MKQANRHLDTSEYDGVTKTEESVEKLAEREMMFSVLARELNTGLGKAIADKTPIEARMLADESQYWGAPSGAVSKDDMVTGYAPQNSRGGMITDNKTRSKTRIASARIGDMLFPTNAPNWAMRPTPYPNVPMDLIMEEYQKQQKAEAPPPEQVPPEQSLMGQMPANQMAMGGEQGGPMMAMNAPPQVEPDYATLAMKVASRRCRKMVVRIRDVLAENDYAKAGRESIMDGCKVGTGILKGPYVRFQTKRSYENLSDERGSVAAIKVERVEVPGVSRVSPWMFFPLRARCIEECEGAYELHILTATQLRKMVKTHGFYPKQINKVLKTRPSLGAVESIMAQRATITNYSMSRYDQSYAAWEYQGVIDGKVLRMMGFDVAEDDDLTSFYGAVWFIDNEIVRIDMSPLEADSSLPYHVWNYEEDETNIFGFGVPFVMRDDQFVIDMIWTSILHNVSVSAGPQIAIEKGVLIPADKSYNVRGPKLWYKNDVDVPMNQAIDAVIIPSTVDSTMPVYQQALQNADSNTNLPLMLGDGGASGSQQGLSGMAQITVMNQTNIVQRQAAHAWDDNITDRLVTKLYHWFMQSDNPEDQDIKGDYDVEVRGASHLLVKDTQAQHAQLLLSMAAGDPTLAAMLHLDELYRIYLNFLDISVDALLKTPEQIEADQATQQPDPMQQAEIAKTNAEAELASAKAQEIMAEAQQPPEGAVPEQLSEKDIMEMQFKYDQLQDKELDRRHNMQVELVRRDTAMLELGADENISYQKIAADLQKNSEKNQIEAGIKQQKQQSDDYFNAARLRLDQYREDLRAENLARGFDSIG